MSITVHYQVQLADGRVEERQTDIASDGLKEDGIVSDDEVMVVDLCIGNGLKEGEKIFDNSYTLIEAATTQKGVVADCRMVRGIGRYFTPPTIRFPYGDGKELVINVASTRREFLEENGQKVMYDVYVGTYKPDDPNSRCELWRRSDGGSGWYVVNGNNELEPFPPASPKPIAQNGYSGNSPNTQPKKPIRD